MDRKKRIKEILKSMRDHERKRATDPAYRKESDKIREMLDGLYHGGHEEDGDREAFLRNKAKREELQRRIDETRYWDLRLKALVCEHFAEEVRVELEDGVSFEFYGCHRVLFHHDPRYEKPCPAREMTVPQIPYFAQDICVTVAEEDGVSFWKCKLDIFPMTVEIWCERVCTK